MRQGDSTWQNRFGQLAEAIELRNRLYRDAHALASAGERVEALAVVKLAQAAEGEAQELEGKLCER